MNIFRLIAIIFFLSGFSFALSGQSSDIPLSYDTAGLIYRQDFDSLPASGTFSFPGKGPFWMSAAPLNANTLTGWQILQVTGSKLNFSVGTGSSTGNAIYSLGNTGSADRALGSLSASTGIYAFGILVTNHTGLILSQASIRFTAEQWRKGGSGNRNTWSFYYKTGILSSLNETDLIPDTHGNFSASVTTTSAGSLNGNQPANQQDISFQLENLLWQPGEQILLRWDDTDESGSDDAVGIDNFQFSATLSLKAPEISLDSLTRLTAGAATISCRVNDHLALTHIVTEYATDSSFSKPKFGSSEPDTLNAGSGTSKIEGQLTDLLPRTNYFARFIATNPSGADTGKILSFQTPVSLPVVSTLISDVFTSSANMGGRITATGGGSILDKGIRWSADSVNLTNQLSIPVNKDSFLVTVTGLPTGSRLYVSAYVTNEGGTAYGDTVRFQTPGTILSLTTTHKKLTPDSVVLFTLTLTNPISGLSPANFSILQEGIRQAGIKSIEGRDSLFIIEMATGSGDGTLGLAMSTDSGLSVPLSNLPYFSTDKIRIDKTPPIIRKILLPDTAAKIGDTLSVILHILPEPDHIAGITGSVDSLSLFACTRLNDSVYQTKCMIQEGGRDYKKMDSIPVTIQLTDSAGNQSFTHTKILPNDFSIDARYPFIKTLQHPRPGWYKTGDSLEWVIHFSETVFIEQNDEPGMSFTLGTRSRSALYSSGNGTDSLHIRYIIQSGDKDFDGINTGKKLVTAGPSLRDRSGNPANLNFANLPVAESIQIDAVAPVIQAVTVPVAGKYFTGDTIRFQIQFSKNVFLRSGFAKPVLSIRIGNNIQFATYHRGAGTQTLEFLYPIQSSDTDTLGIKIISPLTDTITCLIDSLGNPLQTSLHNIGSTTGIQINPSTIQLLETILPADGMYHLGEVLSFGVRYNESAFISGTSNLPSVKIRVGNNTRYATYVGGSGSPVLRFSYQVQKDDEDSLGIRISPFLILNSGGIKDNKGYFAPFLLNNEEWSTKIKVDAVLPEISEILLPDAGIYRSGEWIVLQILFSEQVRVSTLSDSPVIKMTIGSNTRYMTYQSGSGTNQLRFSYQVTPGDLDKNGIKIFSGIIAGKSKLTDIAGNPALLSFTITGSFPRIIIDGIAPIFAIANTDTIQLCENQPPFLITDLFAVNDEEAGELISWRIKNKTSLGTLSVPSLTLPSNGKKLLPTGWFYQPLPDHTGWDSLVTEITDGLYTAQKTIRIYILPAIQNNIIGYPQILCIDQLPDKLSGSQPIGGSGSYGYAWEATTETDCSHFQKIEKDNGDTDYPPAHLSTTTWFRRIVYSGVCKDSSTPVRLTILKEGFWKGDSSRSWEDSRNWCLSRIPSDTTDVYIDSAGKMYPVISFQAACRDITLTAKTHLTIDGILQMNGRMTAPANSIDAARGSFCFTGNTTQFIPGNVFRKNKLKNVYVHTPGNVHLTDSVTVSGKIYLQKGSLYTHDLLTLSGSAEIAPAATGSEIIGGAEVKLSIQGGRLTNRLLAHPFSHSIYLQQLTDSIDITAAKAGNNGFPATDPNLPSAFWFDPEKGTEVSGFDAGWQAFTNTDSGSNNLWKKQQGIRLLIRGKKGQGLDGKPPGDGTNGTYLPGTVTLSLSGKLNTGDQEIQIPVKQSPAYQVVGNPYLGTIDLARVTRTENIGKTFWIWNPLQGRKGGYSSYPFNQSFILPPFGSFIVKANESPGQPILITENCKTEQLPADSVGLAAFDGLNGLEIRLQSDQILWDRLLIWDQDSARSGMDALDAEKLMNPEVNFFSLSKEGKLLSIDVRYLVNHSRIPLGITHALPGSYQLKIAMSKLPATNTLQLYDNYLHQWTSLHQDDIYSFTITSDTATQGMNRFEIKSAVTPDTHLADKNIRLNIFPVPAGDELMVDYHSFEPGNTAIRVLHLSGKPLMQKTLGVQQSGQIGIPVAHLNSGIYLLEFISGQLVKTRKFYKN